MADFEKQAIEILQIIAGESGFVVADSGGKDSSVLTHIAQKSGCRFRVEHNITTVDAPETMRFIRQKFRRLAQQGIRCKMRMPKESLWKMIVRKGVVPTRAMRYCCSELKENYGGGEKVVTGVRKAESQSRKKNRGVVNILNPHKDVREKADGINIRLNPKGGAVILNLDNDENRQLVENCYRTQRTLINPLIDWDDEFLWWYIKHEEIEINPLYGRGWKRVGCIGCPMAGRREREWEFRQYPRYKECYIRAFDEMLITRRERGMKEIPCWKDGRSVFRWWIDEKWNPDQLEIKDWLWEIGAISAAQYNDDDFIA